MERKGERKVRLELVGRLISKLSFSEFKIVDGINSYEKKDSRKVFKNSVTASILLHLLKRAATFIIPVRINKFMFLSINFFPSV